MKKNKRAALALGFLAVMVKAMEEEELIIPRKEEQAANYSDFFPLPYPTLEDSTRNTAIDFLLYIKNSHAGDFFRSVMMSENGTIDCFIRSKFSAPDSKTNELTSWMESNKYLIKLCRTIEETAGRYKLELSCIPEDRLPKNKSGILLLAKSKIFIDTIQVCQFFTEKNPYLTSIEFGTTEQIRTALLELREKAVEEIQAPKQTEQRSYFEQLHDQNSPYHMQQPSAPETAPNGSNGLKKRSSRDAIKGLKGLIAPGKK